MNNQVLSWFPTAYQEHDGLIYLTEGHIILAFDHGIDPFIAEIKKNARELKNLHETFIKSNAYEFIKEIYPLPPLEEILKDIHKCLTCDTATGRCLECDGSGTVDWSNDYHDYEADCKSCDGNGKSNCTKWTCLNSYCMLGYSFVGDYLDFGKCRIAKKMLFLLHETGLENMAIQPAKNSVDAAKILSTTVGFVGGFIMPMRK